MGSQALLQSLKESVLTEANVQAMYGNPSQHKKKPSFQSQRICLPTVRVRAPEASEKRTYEVKAGVVPEEYVPFPWGHRGDQQTPFLLRILGEAPEGLFASDIAERLNRELRPDSEYKSADIANFVKRYEQPNRGVSSD